MESVQPKVYFLFFKDYYRACRADGSRAVYVDGKPNYKARSRDMKNLAAALDVTVPELICSLELYRRTP